MRAWGRRRSDPRGSRSGTRRPARLGVVDHASHQCDVVAVSQRAGDCERLPRPAVPFEPSGFDGWCDARRPGASRLPRFRIVESDLVADAGAVAIELRPGICTWKTSGDASTASTSFSVSLLSSDSSSPQQRSRSTYGPDAEIRAVYAAVAAADRDPELMGRLIPCSDYGLSRYDVAISTRSLGTAAASTVCSSPAWVAAACCAEGANSGESRSVAQAKSLIGFCDNAFERLLCMLSVRLGQLWSRGGEYTSHLRAFGG